MLCHEQELPEGEVDPQDDEVGHRDGNVNTSGMIALVQMFRVWGLGIMDRGLVFKGHYASGMIALVQMFRG